MLKKSIPIIFIFLLFCLLLFGHPAGDIFSEGFEGAGYELGENGVGNWAETVGGGSVVDEDNADIARPADGGDQILKTQKVSPNFNAQTKYNAGADQAVTYTTFYVQITAEGLDDTEYLYVFFAQNAAFQTPWRIFLRQDDSNRYFQFSIYNNGAFATYDTGTISLNTWYRFDVKYDNTGHTWEWVFEEVSQDSGAIIGVHRTGPKYFAVGDGATSETVTAYFDLINVDSSDYEPFAEKYIPKVIFIREDG